MKEKGGGKKRWKVEIRWKMGRSSGKVENQKRQHPKRGE